MTARKHERQEFTGWVPCTGNGGQNSHLEFLLAARLPHDPVYFRRYFRAAAAKCMPALTFAFERCLQYDHP